MKTIAPHQQREKETRMAGAPDADSAADTEAAIKRTVLDYFEGWFEGDAARMERALHPELAKRSLRSDVAGTETLATASAQSMIQATAEGIGKSRDPGDRRIEIGIEDVSGMIANVTVHSTVYIEYVQLVQTRHGWKIVNALWQYAKAIPGHQRA
jgi:hypothetical protein